MSKVTESLPKACSTNSWPQALKIIAIGLIAFGIFEAASLGAFGMDHLITATVAGASSLLLIGFCYYRAVTAKKGPSSKLKYVILIGLVLAITAALVKYEITYPGSLERFMQGEGITIGATVGGVVALFLAIDVVRKKFFGPKPASHKLVNPKPVVLAPAKPPTDPAVVQQRVQQEMEEARKPAAIPSSKPPEPENVEDMPGLSGLARLLASKS